LDFEKLERAMTDRNFTTTITVDQSSAMVFVAINNVRGWWSEDIEGPADKAGETFKYHFQDLHRCKVRVDELVPGRKVAWTITDNYFSFTEDAAEWKGTRIVFDIARKGDKTRLTFTHIGLVLRSSAMAPAPTAGEPTSTAASRI
jgi:hypothetical protein